MSNGTPEPSGSTTYAGELTVKQVWSKLAEEPGACLIDVRTQAEWAYVGLSDLSSLGKKPFLVEWQIFPSMQVDGYFAANLKTQLSEAGMDDADATLMFLCRSGVRSLAAAKVMTSEGYRHCFNVTGGFEGPKDADGHRGTTDGWKAHGLPWVQG